jgi:hypothetical protein
MMTEVTAPALLRSTAPMASARHPGHREQRRGPGHHTQFGQHGHRVNEVAVAAQRPLAERDRHGRADQPGHERDQGDDDGLGGQDPAAPPPRRDPAGS